VIEAFRGLGRQTSWCKSSSREAGNSDIRAFVIGQRVVAAMRRTAAPGEFRSNLHRGGTAERAKLTPEERSTACVRPKPWAERSGRRSAALEPRPGGDGSEFIARVGGIEAASHVDVAGSIIRFLEKKSAAGKTKTKDRIRG